PYFAYVGIASLFQNILPIEVNYILRLIVVPALLVWAWKWYLPLTGPKSLVGSFVFGAGFGIAGLVLWCVLYAPFTQPDTTAWSTSGFFLRLISASLVVPVFEEIVMRGYVFRFVLQWDQIIRNKIKKQKINNYLLKVLDESNISAVRPGAWSVPAVLISSVIFAAGHTVPEWPAALAYGILISILWIIRKDLFSCIIAHATTNLTLALYVYYTGHWEFW
ncbi:MAG: CPBP family intramembrane metalloprotease, partial [Desulfobacteraceae bacterium]|nr:CPBP family intramembrane metalloprotease [Desulfobacteraceae bacterium]